MGKHIFVDGRICATTGNLYTRNIFAGVPWHPDDCIEITPEGGVIEIKEDEGSIFDTYYVSGAVTSGGIDVGAVKAYFDIYKFTIEQYEAGRKLIEQMLEAVPEGKQGNLYCQQQFASVFSLMEQFLSCTFVRQTCDREESYYRVLKSGFFQKRYKDHKDALNGPNDGKAGLKKQILYIDLANLVVYHNKGFVKKLFKAAFNINVNLKLLEEELDTRNDIAHRFGHTTTGREVTVTADDVKALIAKVDKIVHKTAAQINALPPSEALSLEGLAPISCGSASK